MSKETPEHGGTRVYDRDPRPEGDYPQLEAREGDRPDDGRERADDDHGQHEPGDGEGHEHRPPKPPPPGPPPPPKPPGPRPVG
jgi:hypothetical protein